MSAPTAGTCHDELVVRFAGVSVRRRGIPVLDDISWQVGRRERWVVLGPNGSGKTTMLHLAGARMLPTCGTAEVLGHRLGRVDLRTLRTRVAFVSGALMRELRPSLVAREVVVTGRHGALEPWWFRYTDEDFAEADRLLDAAGIGQAAARPFGVLSEGERQHVLICRALMGRPALLLFDEPAAGLDLGARERLVSRLGGLAADPDAPPLVLVTHHAEEVPPGFTHAALLRKGVLLAAGPIEEVLTGSAVSDCFGVSVSVGREAGRWWVRASGEG